MKKMKKMKTRGKNIVLLVLLLNCFFFFSCRKIENVSETKTIIAIEYFGCNGLFTEIGALIKFDDGSSICRGGTMWANGLKIGEKVVVIYPNGWRKFHKIQKISKE